MSFQWVYRLRATLIDLKAFNAKSSQFVAEAVKELRKPTLGTSGFQEAHINLASPFLKERANRIRNLAETTHDAKVKHILLSLADSYDLLL